MTKKAFYELLDEVTEKDYTPRIQVGGYYGSYAVRLENVKRGGRQLYVPQFKYDASKETQPAITICRNRCNKSVVKYKRWLDEWLLKRKNV